MAESETTSPFRSVECPEPIEGLSFVYVLQTQDGTFYVGQAYNVEARVRLHASGRGAKHTLDHTGPRVVYWEGPFRLE